MSEHRWSYCKHCQSKIVICGKCGNNCCNGGYGELEDGSKCDACPSAYDMQMAGWKAVSKPPELTDERLIEETKALGEMGAEMIDAATALELARRLEQRTWETQSRTATIAALHKEADMRNAEIAHRNAERDALHRAIRLVVEEVDSNDFCLWTVGFAERNSE